MRNSIWTLSIVFTFLLSWVSVNGLHAQQYSLRAYGGGLYYLGDLAPLSSSLSVSQYNPSLGISIGKEWNKTFDFHLKYVYGRISGSDEDAKSIGRRERNLSFVSSLYDLGIVTEINLNTWLKGLNRYGLNLYYSTGISVFHFNPQTVYQGRLVKLQPLGTEGQGTESLNTNGKYSLTQISIPFGFGVKFDLNDEFELGFEIIPRWTFTDYLDDVSGAYVPLAELEAANGPLSAALSNRTGEYLDLPTSTDKPAGALRGDPNNADWYMFMGVYVAYKWGSELPTSTQIEEQKIDELENKSRVTF